MTGPVPPNTPPLRIERTFAAPIEAVFDAWTSVDVLRRWWPAGYDWVTTVAEIDARVGGGLRLVMGTPDGSAYGGGGQYVELRPPDRLAFTWRWDDPADSPEQLIEVSFTANADATTTVVLVNSGIAEHELDDHRTGWQVSFDLLDAALRPAGPDAPR